MAVVAAELWLMMMMIAASIAVVGLMGVLVRLYKELVVKPCRLRSMLTNQGITGPPPTLVLGNILDFQKASGRPSATIVQTPAGKAPAEHNCSAAVFPLFKHWRRQYGEVYTFALGNMQIISVNCHHEIVRDITTCTSLDWGKPEYQNEVLRPLLGDGIVTSNGTSWAHQRKVIAPELYMDKVKGMTSMIADSAINLVKSWRSRIDIEGGDSGTADIKIDNDLKSFSGDVISRACFGSSFSEGEEIFLKLTALEEVLSKKTFSPMRITGNRYVPTKSNREAWALEKEIATLILRLAKERHKGGYENDLLQTILEGARNSTTAHSGQEKETDRFIVDNCKNILLAAYETTAFPASWCLMLLAANPDWQERVRTEVIQVCRGHIPDADMLKKMKQLTMVIHESLRLYTPVFGLLREALKDMTLGDINIPKGVNVFIMAATLHTDPAIWGPDSYKFNPERFANGISGACKHPYFYMPFGVGPRVCLGQNLAMAELKMLLALVLSNFSFSLSPKYKHAPILRLVVEPKHGVDLLIRKL